MPPDSKPNQSGGLYELGLETTDSSDSPCHRSPIGGMIKTKKETTTLCSRNQPARGKRGDGGKQDGFTLMPSLFCKLDIVRITL